MYTIQENIIIKESPGPVAGNPAIVSPVKIRLKLPSPLASRHCTPERKIEPSPFFAPENNEIRPLGGPAAPRTPTSIVHRHQPSTTGKSKKANIIHLITKKRTLIQSCPSPIPRKITLKDPHTISEIVTNPISKPFKKRKLPRLAKKSFTPKAANDADSTRLHRYDEHHQPFEFEANLNTKERAEFMTRWALSSGHLDKYHITLLLGWGGCGAVLGGYRKSDRKEVLRALIQDCHQADL